VYIVGYTDGTLGGQPSAGGRDVFVRKYDSAGKHLWTRQFGTASSDVAYGVALHDSGVYVVGCVLGALPGQTAVGGLDVFVRKYSTAGKHLWTRQFGTTGHDYGFSVTVNPSGVYVAGTVEGALPGQTHAGGEDPRDVFVRKYSTAGKYQWTRQFGTTGADGGQAVASDGIGVYVVGYTDGVLPGQASAGARDVFVRRYDTAGKHKWTRQFGTGGWDEGYGLAVDASGVYVTGGTGGPLPGQVWAGGEDAFVRRYNKAGKAGWIRQFGTAGADQASGAAVNPSGVYLAGFSEGALPGQTSAGGRDAFARKYATT
jgi:hypothetical protein